MDSGADQDVTRYHRDGGAGLLQVFVDLLRRDRDHLEPGSCGTGARIVGDGEGGEELQGDGGPQEP